MSKVAETAAVAMVICLPILVEYVQCIRIKQEVKAMKDGIGSMSRQVIEQQNWHGNRSCAAPDVALSEPVEQGQWANLLPELLLDIIRRVVEGVAAWPARVVIVFCASVCRSWRDITMTIVETPEQCGRLTFPISLKQPGPRDFPIQCFIKRDKAASVYRLYFGPNPSEDGNDKFLLAAKRMNRATSNDFVISLAADDFSRARNTYIGKLRSNVLRTKFTIYDRQSSSYASALQHNICLQSRRFRAKQVCTVSYQVNPPGRRGPRKMHCSMLSVPISQPITYFSFQKVSPNCGEALVVENKAPKWHEQMQCWCLDFKGRVTEKSIKNFQLLAATQQEKVILQFGRIGKDIFVMDYCYPLSAFQAFAICLSSFDANPACVG